MKLNPKYIIKQISLFPNHMIGTVLYIISYFYPKNKKIWVYGAWFGQKFNDNSMCFFKYMLKTHPEINSIWITKNCKIYQSLKQKNYPVEKSNSLKGILLHLKAKVVILTSGKYDVNQNLISTNTKTVQLWHGIPLKKILFDTHLEKIYNNFVKYLFFLPILKNLLKFDMTISTSYIMKKRFASSFDLSEEIIPITGYPRNDIFFNSTKEIQSREKIILYAPTHRNEGLDGKLKEKLNCMELERVNNSLEEINVKLYLKLHYYEEKILEGLNLSNIIIIKSDPFFDLQEFLLKTDILITDYSSVYFDYLLLDRPIIFFAYDLEDYKKNDRELYDNYEDVTPGDIVNNWEDVIKSLEKNLKNPDRHSNERKLLCDKYWQHKDGNSSQRVYEAIIKQFNL